MSTITKTPIIIAVIAIVSLFVAGPVTMSMDELNVYANKKLDSASQDLFHGQLSEQSSDVFSENGTSTASGNNVDLSFNLNEGQNSLGQ
ncbi:hypothetical protein [Candidatus Nitrosocosmicus arcticus]|uniref:Uncharacterized protein n=1 Tax=Candidatus Nitrosocosmicus arcticus TaxID=2035267 RepID=A0A557SS20_9ARCH|nr:hypothetical protein [Candidatus Nitrosocosmicus arcticus]TVP39413.1 exported protein of unknown function [Candidatus Nitrosocosmicus arcticus]